MGNHGVKQSWLISSKIKSYLQKTKIENHSRSKYITLNLFLNSHLISMQDLKEGFVDVWLALEAILDLIDIVDGMIELYRLVVL